MSNSTSTSTNNKSATATATPTSSSIISSTAEAVASSSSASTFASTLTGSVADVSSSTTAPADTTTLSKIASSTSLVQSTTSTTPLSTPVQTTSSTAGNTTPTHTSSIAASTTVSTTATTSSISTTASASLVLHTTVSVVASSNGHPGSTVVVTVTSTETAPAASGTNSSSSTHSAGLAGASSGSSSSSSSSGGLSTGGKTAIAVIIPIVAVAGLIAAGIWFWRRRRANKDAEDLRRKEVEEYGYNPNDDPTLPAVGGGPRDGPFQMVEGENSGYRGWGATAASSSHRKASTNVSGGAGQGVGSLAYTDSTSPTLNGPSGDTPLMAGSPTYHPLDHPVDEGDEIVGAMGPTTDKYRGEVQRGPSNASSSYSAANHSDGSGDASVPGGAVGQANYYNDYAPNAGGGPYNDGGYVPGGVGVANLPQPVIRDVQAKRNTRIEHPSHFPQQGGISQNF